MAAEMKYLKDGMAATMEMATAIARIVKKGS
jgi:hypothetical protein